MSGRSPLTRRSFLTTSAAAALAAPALGAQGANERINLGLIGTGGRCRHLMQALARIPNVRMVALCDVYEPHLEAARKLADPKATVTRNYRDVLNRKDIQGVVIATPDHWHAPITVD